MPQIHIANAQFEWELQQNTTPNLIASLQIHPIYLQLQFLPCLYSHANDIVLTTHKPEPDYPNRLKQLGIAFPHLQSFLAKDLPHFDIDTWGNTPSISSWAASHHLAFTMPRWETVKEVNSKEFSFTASPKLAFGSLLTSEEEAYHWFKQTEGPKVLKSVYGLSGKGHFHLRDELDDKALNFLKKQWKLKHPVLAEPWVERILDFSSQWTISSEGLITYLGITICKNSSRGTYLRSIVQPIDSLDPYDHFLVQHKEAVLPILSLMYKKGYFGHVGVDAMIYQKHGHAHLQPVVEINARKTMGWVALTLQKRYFATDTIMMSYDNVGKENNLLPNFCVSTNNEIIPFSKVLRLEILPKNKSWKDVYF